MLAEHVCKSSAGSGSASCFPACWRYPREFSPQGHSGHPSCEKPGQRCAILRTQGVASGHPFGMRVTASNSNRKAPVAVTINRVWCSGRAFPISRLAWIVMAARTIFRRNAEITSQIEWFTSVEDCNLAAIQKHPAVARGEGKGREMQNDAIYAQLRANQ